MFVAYIALGIAAGFLAAILTFVAGHGILLSITAYICVGTTVIMAYVFWALLPQRRAPVTKPQVTQRS